MKRFLCITLFLCIIFPASAGALDFNETYFFVGSDAGGTGSATMEIDIVGNTLTATLDNTSPTSLDSGPGDNAPGITFFGFDLDPSTLGNPNTWTLTAYDSGGGSVLIGDDAGTGSGDWELTVGGQYAGIEVEYISSAGIPPEIKGALYNPSAVGSSALAALPNYFTEAILTLNFDAPGQDAPIFIEDFENFSPFVRMQNVGADLDGDGDPDGSLKLTPIPEPSTMIISSLFLLGAGVFVRRKLHQKS